ncbi:hypothetical protein, partial [Ferrovum myxofaciens]|uniref:hypothetical protein n=1 Tax=Ferrovum myxofaciens TaxID=416213 RepID=UPI001D0D7979
YNPSQSVQIKPSIILIPLTDEQRQFLLNKGCTHYQGYLFGRPMPIEQFEFLLQQSPVPSLM